MHTTSSNRAMLLFSSPDQKGLVSMITGFIAQYWNILFTGRKLRVAVMVSKYEHCLQELLWRQRLTESAYEVPLIISNHSDLESMANYHGIPYHVFPITKENKESQEKAELKLLKESGIDLVNGMKTVVFQ